VSADLVNFALTGVSFFVIATGMIFVLAGAIGILRLPDFYTRMHAAGMTDTLGAELVIFGLMIQAGFSQTSLKLLLVAFFLFITSPTATHAVSNAAHQAGLKPLLGKFRAPHPSELEANDEGGH
jgi:multicomponent Na+:H+ antiporter subunit G